MAPSKKLDNNGEESQLEPQIPENTYPFSQHFTASPKKDTADGEDSTSPVMDGETSDATPGTPGTTGATGTTGAIVDAKTNAMTTGVHGAIPGETEEKEGITGDPFQASMETPHAAPKDAQVIPPQAGKFAAPEKKASPHQLLENAGLPDNEISADTETPPLPASAFSKDDYLTADEAQAYILGEVISEARETATGPDASTMEASTPKEKAIPMATTPSQQDIPSGEARDKNEKTGEQAQKSREKRFFGKKKDKTTDKSAGKPLDKTLDGAQGKTTPKTVSAPSASPAAQPFFSSHPILRTTPSMPGGLSNAIFTSCSFAPWLLLTLFFVLQTIFTLDARALWHSDEVRHAAAFTAMLKEGYIFKLELNGQLYPDKPPLYFWFLRGLYEIFQEEGPRLYFGAAAISGLLYLWATLLLGRFAGRFDGRSLFAGGILLISSFSFMAITHYARMDLLFSSFIIGSYTSFFVAFAKPKAPLLMSLAFILGALACLTKGPLGLLLPLSALLLFSLWTGRVRRFFSADFFMGLVIAVLIVGGWLAGLYTETSLEYIQDKILGEQVLERAVDAFHHKHGWSYYLKSLPFLLLPWIGIVLCLPFAKLFSKNALAIVAASRKPEREGQAYLWCIIISALILLSAISTKIAIYLLPVFPAMCLLAGRAVIQLSSKRAFCFKLLLGIILLLAGIAFFLATLRVSGSLPLPEFIDKKIPVWEITPSIGFFIAAAILCATSLFLFFGVPSSRPEGVLLTLGIMATALAYPLFGMAAPKIDATMSPKVQGEIIKQHIAEGYYPLTYDMYDGIYTYYAGANIEEVYSVEDITAKLEEHPRIILAIQQRALNKITNMPECFVPIHRQLIEKHEYVLLACPPMAEDSLAKETAPEQESGIDDAVKNEEQDDTKTAPAEANAEAGIVPDSDNVPGKTAPSLEPMEKEAPEQIEEIQTPEELKETEETGTAPQTGTPETGQESQEMPVASKETLSSQGNGEKIPPSQSTEPTPREQSTSPEQPLQPEKKPAPDEVSDTKAPSREGQSDKESSSSTAPLPEKLSSSVQQPLPGQNPSSNRQAITDHTSEQASDQTTTPNRSTTPEHKTSPKHETSPEQEKSSDPKPKEQ